MREIGEQVLAVCRAMAPGGGYRFRPGPRADRDPHNPRDPDYDGVRHDLSVDGEVVAVGSGGGPTYCCGVTFEAWLSAWLAAGGGGQSPAALRELLASWFCPVMGHGGAAVALVDAGLGVAVAPEAAMPGDLCQFWRRTDLASPSGHSVVFLGWEDREDGRWIRYFSSQPATDGVGEHAERVADGWTLHFARPVVRRR